MEYGVCTHVCVLTLHGTLITEIHACKNHVLGLLLPGGESCKENKISV